MSDKNLIDGRGRPRKGYEARDKRITVRLEPYEYDELQAVMRLTGDSLTDALRQGVSLYVKSVRQKMQNRREEWSDL